MKRSTKASSGALWMNAIVLGVGYAALICTAVWTMLYVIGPIAVVGARWAGLTW